MENVESYKSALIAIIVEARKKGFDVDELVENACGGLMGTGLYAPPGSPDKPKAIKALKKAHEKANGFIEVNV